MNEPEAAPSLHGWAHLVRTATSAPDTGTALERVLAELVAASGAEAGAVLTAEPLAVRECWGRDRGEMERLLYPGCAVSAVLDAAPAAREAPLLLPSGTDAPPALLAPLPLRGVRVGWLLLLFAPGADPGAAPAEAVALAGDLVALLLDNDRLYEEARAALQARDHFLTALNHELRTPATGFTLTADLLRYESGSDLPPRVARLLDDTEAHVEQMVGALHRVLDLGHLSDHADPERNDVVRPRELVADLMRRVEPTARRKRLELALFVPRGLAPLQTDAGRMARILLHLLGNALKYTTEGGIEVRMERSVQRLMRGRPEPALVIRVRDSGCGIPPEELERVLEPFTQVDEGSRTDSRTRGLGLGLPLARQMARSLGGDIRLESTAGLGTTAILLLPYHKGSE